MFLLQEILLMPWQEMFPVYYPCRAVEHRAKILPNSGSVVFLLFGAKTSALVLVDGFERDMDDISIEDIESFQVLKDASETAIYGARGANGVY